jgi:hypothetical protein
LARKSPKTGLRRSLRTIATELAAHGHLAPSVQPYYASSIRHMLATGTHVGVSWRRELCGTYSAADGAGMALGRGDFRRVIAKAVRLIGILKIFVSK